MNSFLNRQLHQMKLNQILILGSILILVLIMQPAFAQTESDTGVKDPTLRYGAKLGGVSSAFSVDYADVTDAKKGLLVGGFVHYRLLPWLTLNGEVLYQQQGAANLNKETTDEGVTTFSNIIQHVIDIPVLAIITPPGFENSTPILPYISVGGDYAYIMQSYSINKTHIKFENGSSFMNQSYRNVTNSYKQFEFGAIVGMGVIMKTSGFMYTIDLRYRVGLTSINNIRPDNPANDFSTNVTSVSVGLGF